ncbi:MAG TPA: integrase core domain-containing protein [Actinomycetota bacterium]|nr:integrase core domain-containing protein [Actinomycetota bacterium]
MFRTEGTEVILTPIRAPKANAYAERWVETVRAECLDHLLVYGRRHLERTLRTYADHYNQERPHRGLALAVPDRPSVERVPVRPRDVRRRPVLGGLINEYHGAAA